MPLPSPTPLAAHPPSAQASDSAKDAHGLEPTEPRQPQPRLALHGHHAHHAHHGHPNTGTHEAVATPGPQKVASTPTVLQRSAVQRVGWVLVLLTGLWLVLMASMAGTP